MSFITAAKKIAAHIDTINAETIAFLQSQAGRVFDMANTEGQQQAIMDELGTQAVSALTTYNTIRGALASLGAADGIPEADPSIFQAQQDGTVLYVPPAEPQSE